ncbi:MAG: hypothetical protein V1797_10230 [Pseudomonadota bacterium]
MTPEARARLSQAAAAVVARASRAGRLVTREEVLETLGAEGLFAQAGAPADAGPAPPTIDPAEAASSLDGILAGHPQVASLASLSGQTVYHLPELLSRSYALILDRKDFPLLLLAEEVRTNARDYLRPVPLELFLAPPFDLAPEDLEHLLRVMAADPAYRDIALTSAEGGARYLYSTRHLEHHYARFLAQQAESLSLNS